jgi:hypothetical protein
MRRTLFAIANVLGVLIAYWRQAVNAGSGDDLLPNPLTSVKKVTIVMQEE